MPAARAKVNRGAIIRHAPSALESLAIVERAAVAAANTVAADRKQQ